MDSAASVGDSSAMGGIRVVREAGRRGVVATRRFARGEAVTPVRWDRRRSSPTRWTVQIGAREHAAPRPRELAFLNHACEPNTGFDDDARTLRALREVAAGEELRFSYLTTEWELAEPFDCDCGAARCAGTIAGAALAGPAALRGLAALPHVRAALAARVREVTP